MKALSFLIKLQFRRLCKNIIPIILRRTFEKDFFRKFNIFSDILCIKPSKHLMYIETISTDLSAIHIGMIGYFDKITELIEMDENILKSFHIENYILKSDKENFYFGKSKNFRLKELETFKTKNNHVHLVNINKKNILSKNKSISKNNFKGMGITRDNITINKSTNEIRFFEKNFGNKVCFKNENKEKHMKSSNMHFWHSLGLFHIKLYDLFSFEDGKKICILINYNSQSLTLMDLNGLVRNLDTNSILSYNEMKRLEKRLVNQIESFDCDGNIIFIGEKVQIISGEYKEHTGIIRFIHEKVLFISSVKFSDINGILRIKSTNTKICF
nr:hypothetical protein 1634Bnrm3_p052 [Cryptomonas sp.]